MRKNIDRDCLNCNTFKKAASFHRSYSKYCKKCTNLAARSERKTNVPDLKFQQLAQGLWK